MKISQIIDTLEIGIPVVITTTYQNVSMRSVNLYLGEEIPGIYNFIDNSGRYRLSAGYLNAHTSISLILETDKDIFELAQLISKIKGVKQNGRI